MSRVLTERIIRRFVPDHEKVTDPAVRYAYGRTAGVTGILCNILLCLIKLLAGIFAHSVAIVADAFNNLSDAGSSIVTLVGFKLSGAPADKEHPFGHGRVEYLSAMGVAVLIVLAGFELGKTAFDKILHPVAAEVQWLTVAILAAAIIIKLWMAVFYRKIGKRIRSDALIASGADSRNDVICTGVVLISSLVSRFTGLKIDGAVGLLVALFVMWSGFSVIREAVSPLLGRKPDEALVDGIEQTVLTTEGIVGIHDMMVHDYGPGRVFVSLHAEVPASENILISHDRIDQIERLLLEKYNIISCIHMDPVDTDNPETLRLKALTMGLLNDIDGHLTMHDFRVVPGDTHTNVLFDVTVPFDYPHADTLSQTLQDGLRKEDHRLNAVIKIENRYT